MAIVYHEDFPSVKGIKDAKRHQEKIDDAIRKNVKGVIGNEDIISTQGKKKVRIPVKGMKDYRFVHGGSDGAGGGIGQGDGKPGDVIGRRPKQGQGQGQGSGSGQGQGDMEAEVDIDYLLDIMFEDLGLPWLDPKKQNSIEIPKGWKFESISKKGVFSRVHKKRTMKEAIKRNVLFVQEVINNTELKNLYGTEEGFEEAQNKASQALNQAKGDILEAINIVKENRINPESETGFLIQDDDLRYKQIEEDVEICSKAVVFALMDVSGSMTPDKKYLMKSLLFWIVSWLRKQYEYVDIRFIQHTEVAKEVDENTFFYGGESGGTVAASAFNKANHIIDTEYPTSEWNIYTIYCSDGEDWQPAVTINSIEEMLNKKINMLSYVEVKPDHDLDNSIVGYNYGYSTLLPEIKKKWNFHENQVAKDGKFWINEEMRFLLSVIKDKTHIWPCISHMLGIHNRTPESA